MKAMIFELHFDAILSPESFVINEVCLPETLEKRIETLELHYFAEVTRVVHLGEVEVCEIM